MIVSLRSQDDGSVVVESGRFVCVCCSNHSSTGVLVGWTTQVCCLLLWYLRSMYVLWTGIFGLFPSVCSWLFNLHKKTSGICWLFVNQHHVIVIICFVCFSWGAQKIVLTLTLNKLLDIEWTVNLVTRQSWIWILSQEGDACLSWHWMDKCSCDCGMCGCWGTDLGWVHTYLWYMTTPVLASLHHTTPTMKHPDSALETIEFNLGRAPDLRCTEAHGDVPSCGKCDGCRLGHHMGSIRSWLRRAGHQSRRRFILGLIRRLHSVDLIQYVINLLRPLMCKDFTYARTRPTPSLPGDRATSSGDRALDVVGLEMSVANVWVWFEAASYWTKANFLLSVLQQCDAHELHLVVVHANTLLVPEQRAFTAMGRLHWRHWCTGYSVTGYWGYLSWFCSVSLPCFSMHLAFRHFWADKC